MIYSRDIKNWAESITDTQEMINLAKKYPQYKMVIIQHVALKSTNKAHMVEPLLNSGIYEPKDIANARFLARYYDEKALLLCIQFSEKFWQNSTDYDEVMGSRVLLGTYSKDEDAVNKMKYFYFNNKPVFEDFKQAFVYENGVGKMYEIMQEIPVSKKDLYNFEKEYYKSLKSSAFKHVLSYEPSFAEQDSVALVMYRVNDNNKWQIFEQVAKENQKLFQNIIDYYVKVKPNKASTFRYIKDEIMARYGDKKADEIPEAIYKYIEGEKITDAIQQSKKIQKEKDREYEKKSWYLLDGSEVELFTIGGFVPTLDDYRLILEKYLEDGLSIEKFYKKYAVDNIDGFKTMLEKFSLSNPDLKTKIDNTKQRISGKYFATILSNIEDVCEGKCSVEDFINSSVIKNKSWDEFKQFLLKNGMFDKLEKINTKIIEYYHRRINSCDLRSIEPQQILNSLNYKEIKFILGNDNFDELQIGKKFNLGKEFLSLASTKYIDNPRIITEKVAGRTPDRIFPVLEQYNVRYKKNQGATLTIMLESGQWYEVPEQVINDAEQFVKDTGLYKGAVVMGNVIRSIANGKLDVKNYVNSLNITNRRTDAEKPSLPHFNNLKDYLNYIDHESIM